MMMSLCRVFIVVNICEWIEFDNDEDGVPVRRSLIGSALQ